MEQFIGVLSPVWYFGGILILYLAAYWIGEFTGWASLVPAKESAGNYYSAIDGLRGILALSVFFHHSAIAYFYLHSGVWQPPPSNFYAQLGPFAVTMFFFVTGFLFWQKLMKSGGLRFWPFLLNRLRRLGPAYLASIGLVVSILAIQFGLTLRTSPVKLALQLACWISCGVPFGFYDINHVRNTSLVNASVAWSLRIEWGFYLILPFLAWFATKWRATLWIAICGLIGYFKYHPPGNTWANTILDLPIQTAFYTFCCFSGGILAAIAKTTWRLEPALRHWICTPIALGLCATTLFFAPPRYGLVESALLAPVFLMIVFGNDFHGLLSSRFLTFPGVISYSLYLMHGIVIYVFTQTVRRYLDVAALSPVTYWMAALGVGLVVVTVCSLNYRYVEFPFMVKRKRVAPQPLPVIGPDEAIASAADGIQ